VADAEHKKPVNVYTLLSVMDEFISDNSHSYDLETRWFAKFLDDDVRPIGRRVRSGGLNGVEKENVAAFRLAEIRAAKDAKQREIDALDREAADLGAGH
jgi:hypothetical protein